MSTNTNIEWCDHTFNPWTGCTPVSPGCDHCYAEGWAKRSGQVQWGPKAPRRRTSIANWNLPRRWNAQAEAFMAQHGRRQRVFCASLADVFDNAVDPQWRVDLLELVAATPNLDWLLLTKRIGNAERLLDEALDVMSHGLTQWRDAPWPNVWLGATVVNQAEADRDIPKLLQVPARVRFLSMEPLLGPVDVRFAFADVRTACCHACGFRSNQVGGTCPNDGTTLRGDIGIDWVIVGGESGLGARPMNPAWARSLRDQCGAARVPFLFKQWGEWFPQDVFDWDGKSDRIVLHQDNTGYRPTSVDLPRVILDANVPSCAFMQRIGKKAAGRLLDGREWNGVPA